MQNDPRGASAILLTFIKLPFVIKILVLSIFEWPFYKGFTVGVLHYIMNPAFFTIIFRYWFKFIFVNSKLDKDLKRVIDFFFFHFLFAFKKVWYNGNFNILSTIYFSISYMYLNRVWLSDNCKAKIKKILSLAVPC